MQLTRRKFLSGIIATAAAVSLPGHELYRRKQAAIFEEPASTQKEERRKRVANFEESSIVVMQWFERNGLNPTILHQFEAFKASLNFDIDASIDTLVKDTIGMPNKRGFLRKGDHVFELSTHPKSEQLIAFSGKIIGEIKIGSSDVYILDFVVGEAEGIVGRHVAETRRVYVHTDRIWIPSKEDEDGDFEIKNFSALFKENRQKIKELLGNRQLNMEKFRRFWLELVAKYRGWIGELVHGLVAIRFRLLYKQKYGGFKTHQDGQKALRDFVFTTLIHEMVHRMTDEFIRKRNISLTAGEAEFLGVLTELAYGENRYYRLSELLKIYVEKEGGKDPESYVAVAKDFLNGLKRLRYGIERIAAIESEEEIKELGFLVLDDFCKYKFGLPFDKVVNVSLFEEAKRFVESIDVGKD